MEVVHLLWVMSRESTWTSEKVLDGVSIGVQRYEAAAAS